MLCYVKKQFFFGGGGRRIGMFFGTNHPFIYLLFIVDIIFRTLKFIIPIHRKNGTEF